MLRRFHEGGVRPMRSASSVRPSAKDLTSMAPFPHVALAMSPNAQMPAAAAEEDQRARPCAPLLKPSVLKFRTSLSSVLAAG